MTKKQINNISINDAIAISSKNGLKISFNTRSEEIKSFARKVLRDGKKKIKQ